MNTNRFCVHHFMSCTKCMYVHQEPPFACAPSSTLCMGIKAPPLQGSKASSSPSMEKESKTHEATNSFCVHHLSCHAQSACMCIKSHFVHVLQAPPCAWAARSHLCEAPKPPLAPRWRKNASHTTKSFCAHQSSIFMSSTMCMYVHLHPPYAYPDAFYSLPTKCMSNSCRKWCWL